MSTEYVVMRSFHMGEITLNLSAGERLSIEGKILTRLKTGETYTVEGFSMLVKAQLVVEDTGDITFERAEKVPVVERPKMPIIVDREAQIVAKVKLPTKVAGRTKTTQEVAKLTGKTASRHEVFADQIVVGQASVRDKTIDSGLKSEGFGKSAGAKNTVIDSQMQAEGFGPNIPGSKPSIVDAQMQAEGFGPNVKKSMIIIDEREGTIVGKVESFKDREERLQREEMEAREAMIEATKVEVVEEEPVVVDDGLPKGFPHKDHWRKRLLWCRTSNNARQIKAVYKGSTDSFKKQLKKAFPNIKF